MTGARFLYFVTSLLILRDVVAASKVDGLCTVDETYPETKQIIVTYKTKVKTTIKCKFLGISISFKTCYDYTDQIASHTTVEHVIKTRKRQQCCEGYLLKEGSCVPFCVSKCINGYCSGFNECSCNSGYEPTENSHRCKEICADGFKYDESLQRCEPVCSVPCLNGRCSKPEFCECSLGYHKNDEGNCMKNECDPEIPQSNDCLNGICTSFGVCLCNEGFVKNNSSLLCELVCDEGFELNGLKSECIPKCGDGCVNGICVSPENCTCNVGYHSNEEGNCTQNECDPATPQRNECPNGICTSNGVCLCNEGFVKNDSSLICELVCDEGFELNVLKSECIPKCEDGCVNGNCSSPGKCTCNDGYQSNDEGNCMKNECDPVTPQSNECPNGTCTSIGVCVCNQGFVKNDSSLICESVCDEEFEWNLLKSECQPKCVGGCVNGNCLSPNNCICNEGFEFSEELKQCIPACDEKCVNSDCKYPNVCTCWSGFSPTNSTHCKITCENCTYGYCEVANVYLTKNSTKDEDICTNCSATKDGIVHNQSTLSGGFNIWIFILAVLAMALCATSVLVYRRYMRKISYRCNSIYYEDESQFDSL